MTDTNSAKPTGTGRSSRYRWGCAILSILVVAGLFLAALQLSSKLSEIDPENQLTRQVESMENHLRESAADGVLTDEEILRSTSRDSNGDPKVRQDEATLSFDTAVHVNTSSPFGSSGAKGCYTFTITKPISASSQVTATKLGSCDSLISGN